MTNTDDYKAALNTLNQYIWEHKLRHTAEREIILQIMCNIPQPFMPSKVVEKAQKENISQATVYNCINLFDKIGIISLLQKRVTKSTAQWEVVSGKHNRLQLICKKCGRVADFKDIAITNAVKLRKYSNFVPEHFTIFVYGECKHCRKI